MSMKNSTFLIYTRTKYTLLVRSEKNFDCATVRNWILRCSVFRMSGVPSSAQLPANPRRSVRLAHPIQTKAMFFFLGNNENARFRAYTAVQSRFSIFLNVTGGRLIVGCRHFHVSGKQIDPIFKIRAGHSSWTTGALKM